MLRGSVGKGLAYGAVFIAAALIQSAWLGRLQIWGAVLDPLWPLVVAVGVLRGAEAGAVGGVGAGLL